MREISSRHEFVSQDDERYRLESKQIAKDMDTGGSLFSLGKKELDFVNSTERTIQHFRDRAAKGDLPADRADILIANEERAIIASLGHVFDELSFRAQADLDFRLNVRLFLNEVLQDTKVVSFWTTNEIEPPHDGIEFLKRIQNKAVPLEVLKRILELRQEHQERIQKEWEPRFEEWKTDFKQQLQKAIDNGMIPANLAYNGHIADTSFRVLDELTGRSLQGRNHGNGVISIQVIDRVDDRKPEQVRQTIFHELTHSVSGAVIQNNVRELERYDGAQIETRQYRARKRGLHFLSTRGLNERGTWLNEGLTELLAMYLAEERRADTYPYEQAVVVEAIQKHNIPHRLFIDAYFESRAEQSVKGSRLPAFLALHEAMSKEYGKDWVKNQQKRIESLYNGKI